MWNWREILERTASAPVFKPGKDFPVGTGKGEVVKLREREPFPVLLVVRFREFGAIGLKRDAVTGDGVFDDAKRFGGGEVNGGDWAGCVCPLRAAPGWSNCGAPGATRPTVNSGDLDIREFPEVRVHNSVRSLANEKFAVALDDKSEEAAGGRTFAFPNVGELLLQIPFSRNAESGHGTGVAPRRARLANERAEFHEGLVEVGTGGCVMRDA